MAIARMAKVMIVSHRTEASGVLEALQGEGICQVLNAADAAVSKDWPELAGGVDKPRDVEELLIRLNKVLAFLKDYAEIPGGLGAALAPRIVVEQAAYDDVVGDEGMLDILSQCESVEAEMDRLTTERENLEVALAELEPWKALETPLEELRQLETAVCLAGLIPSQHFDQVVADIGELGGEVEQVGSGNNKYACLVVCMKENAGAVQKLLRSVDFEQAGFEQLTGPVAELIEQYSESLAGTYEQYQSQSEAVKGLAQNYLKLQMLADHYSNLLSREQARNMAPATEQAVILECWVKEKDYARLEKIVSGFSASSLSMVEPAEDEDVPVEIENKGAIKPFEVVTRLYGMPQHFEVDPTVFLAPFFALFFALCLTDAGYGIVMIVAIAWFVKRMQGDTKLMWMLGICSAATVVAGALTGGWFGDAVQQLNIGWLNAARAKMMWFDPLEKPMMFFGLSLILGYVQILAGLVIAFCHNLKQKDYVAAVFDQLTWLVMLNSVVIYGASKGGALPAGFGAVFGKVALVPAAAIFLFSQREGGWGGRLGMGAYNLFSAIFYMGDVLSYLRLMALGMVTAGLGMAINVIAGIAYEIPYGIGIVLMILVLVGGHGFNLAISGLSAFVHTLRLQYVEFFPKFIAGGGKLFDPLDKQYEHVYIRKT